MTIVLVHGNPESAAVWEPLVRALGDRDEIVRLSPPGFGAPVPRGFGATVTEYRDWLIAELEEIGEPVDLVGHDAGGTYVVTVAMARPDLLRTWASDVLGVFDPDYAWHDMARIWQTPGEGEDHVAQLLGGDDAERAERFVGVGLPREVATAMAPHQDETMQRCILALYRSVAQPAMAEIGRELPAAAARPGLAIIPLEDPFTGGPVLARRAAERARASVAELPGAGHWWVTADPHLGAEALTRFWADPTG